MNIIRKGCAWFADYVYAGWRQVCAVFSQQSADKFHQGSRAPIVIIPGVYERWRFMLPLIREFNKLGHPVHVIENLRDNRMPVSTGALITATYLTEHELRRVIIVAHSKGGLIGKQLMSFGDPLQRVDRMLAIATPFQGSRYARLFLNRTLRAFMPGNQTLTILDKSASVNSRIVSIFAKFDPHIPGGSELRGARNVCVNTSGHFRILRRPEVREELLRVIDSADS